MFLFLSSLRVYCISGYIRKYDVTLREKCRTEVATMRRFTLFRPFTPDLKLISFTNPFLHSHSYSFWTAFADLDLMKGALAFVCFSFFFLYFFLATCAEYSAFESKLSSIVSYRIKSNDVTRTCCMTRCLSSRSRSASCRSAASDCSLARIASSAFSRRNCSM